MTASTMLRAITLRELQILAWIATGKSDWEIATILNLSAKTINFHTQNVKRKLGTRSRIQAIAVALRDGMIPFPDRISPRLQPPIQLAAIPARPALALTDAAASGSVAAG
jgi:DNA-binding CsgD family transcriptional regulator